MIVETITSQPSKFNVVDVANKTNDCARTMNIKIPDEK